MAKVNDYMNGRNEGMAYALKKAEEEGIDSLRKEVQFRNITGVGLNISRQELKEASKHMAMHATVTAIAISVDTLKEEFSFSNFQLKKFKDLFDKKVRECCDDDSKLVELVTRAEMSGITLINKED